MTDRVDRIRQLALEVQTASPFQKGEAAARAFDAVLDVFVEIEQELSDAGRAHATLAARVTRLEGLTDGN